MSGGNKYSQGANSNKYSTDNDKSLYESSRSDSGFISSGNLLISGEIQSEEIQSNYQQPQQEQRQDSGVLEDYSSNQNSMRLDSGIDTCLSQLSGLSINRGLNDLGKGKCQSREQPWELYYEQDEDGDTQLHAAILQCFPEVAFALIKMAPHPRLLDTPNDDGQAPLHLAVATGQFRIVRWLIVAGARPSPRNRTGDSPLHVAARTGDLLSCKAITDPVQQQEREMMDLLFPPTPYQHCDFDQWNYDGQTCVHVAALSGYIDVLRHLVWYGADINAREGRSGYTALHFAIERRDENLVNFLLVECKKLDVETLTYGGRSALQLGLPVAASLFETLLSRGAASPYTSEDEDDSEDEMYDEKTNIFNTNIIINASA